MVSKGDQLRKIDALFSENVNSDMNNGIKVIETKSNANCSVHNRRRSSGISSNKVSSNTNNLNNHNDNISSSSVVYRNKKALPQHQLAGQMELSKRTASIISSFGFDQNLDRRRQSYTEGYNQQSLADKTRKRNSWNSNMYNRPLEHPSAFPSLLRSDTAPRKINTSSVNRSNSHLNNSGSTNNYDALLYNGGLTSLSRHASMSAINTNKNAKQKSSTLDNTNKRQSFGSNLYLRTDSSGQTNLVKRDSFGSRSNLPRKGSSVPRDMLFIGSQPNLMRRDLYGSKPNLTRKSSVPRDFNRVSSPSLAKSSSLSKSTTTLRPLPNPSIVFEKTSILRKPSTEIYTGDGEKPKLTKENLTRHVRILESDNVFNNNKFRRQSNGSSDDFLKSRRMSIDSLDTRKNSIDSAADDLSNLSLNNHMKSLSISPTTDAKNENGRPHFVAVTSLEDVQAVRCAEFHPSGRIYAVGSNSKTFRICEYPSLSEVREEHTTYQPTVLFKRTKHHKGSIYCMGWAPDGELVATGSNDKTIKLMRYNEVNKQLEGREIELTMHDGTVRDLCFLEDSTNKASLLISGGAGDCKIYVTDCATATPFQALSGHGGHILSLYNWGGAMFVSGSQDKTIRFWDLRTRGCVNTITPATNPGSRQGSPVAAVCVDPSGRLLVSGHEDSSCVLYDIRGNRPIQCFKPHSADIRSIRFSPSAYYLLTSGYDNKLVLTDLQGDLTLPLPSVVVAHHADKVISGRWHPTDFSFLSTSADKTATLWALPPM